SIHRHRALDRSLFKRCVHTPCRNRNNAINPDSENTATIIITNSPIFFCPKPSSIRSFNAIGSTKANRKAALDPRTSKPNNLGTRHFRMYAKSEIIEESWAPLGQPVEEYADPGRTGSKVGANAN